MNRYMNEFRLDEAFDAATTISALATAFRVPAENVVVGHGAGQGVQAAEFWVRAEFSHRSDREPMPVVMAVAAAFDADLGELQIVAAIAESLDCEVFVRLLEPESGVREFLVYPSGARMWAGHFLDLIELVDPDSWPDYLDEAE